jgi:Sgf11 (transcriptional regulation protein)
MEGEARNATAGTATASAAPAPAALAAPPPLALALPPPPSVALDEIPGAATTAVAAAASCITNVPADQTILTVEPPRSLPQRLRANFQDTFDQQYQALVQTILLEQHGGSDGAGLSTVKRRREDNTATETMATAGTDSNHESQMGASSCLDHDKAKIMRQSLYPSLYATMGDSGDAEEVDMEFELQRFAVELPAPAATAATTTNASVTDNVPASDMASASSPVETASKATNEALPLLSNISTAANRDIEVVAAATLTPSTALVDLPTVESDEKNQKNGDLVAPASSELAPTTSTVENGAATTVVAPLAPPPALLPAPSATPPPPLPHKQRYTDIWGNVPAKEPSYWVECTVCKNNTKVNALRFASHLDKCMGIRTMSRSASAAAAAAAAAPTNAASLSASTASHAAAATGTV